jgi:transposase
MKSNSSKTTIGLDLGDRKHAYWALDGKGEVLREGSIPNTRGDLEEFSEKFPGALIAMEVGMQSPWTSRYFQELGHRVLVANARKVRAICQNDRKNDRKSDRKDAEMLARLARSDEKLLSPIEHGSEQAQRDLLQIKLRDNLVRQRVDVISAVRFTLKSMGVKLRSPNTTCFARHARRALEEEHPDLLAMIEPSLQVIDAMTEQIRCLERAIEKLATESYPETEFLRQIPGVGVLTSLTFVLTIGDPQRFERARDVAAYLGLVPKRDQSGDTDKQLRISKAGDACLRRLLVSAVQYVLGPFGPDCRLKRKGLELAERGGPRAKKKAVVATARKLTLLMYALWRDEALYRPMKRAA